jgi:hypothetical protein
MKFEGRAGILTVIGLGLATASCGSGTASPPPVMTCATEATPDSTFNGPGTLDTSAAGSSVGAGYGQASCPDQYLVELDVSQAMFQGHDVFVAGVWTPTVPASPCDEHATMDVFVFDGTAWKSWDVVSYTGAGDASGCRARAQSHSNSASSGLDGTKIPSAMNFQKARFSVGAVQGSAKVPVLVSTANL